MKVKSWQRSKRGSLARTLEWVSLIPQPPETVHKCILHSLWEEVHGFHQVVPELVTPNRLRLTIQLVLGEKTGLGRGESW